MKLASGQILLGGSFAAVLALTACSSPELADNNPSPAPSAIPPVRPPPPPYVADTAPAAAPPEGRIETTELLGGPPSRGDEVAPTLSSTPVPNPEDLSPEDRARIYGPERHPTHGYARHAHSRHGHRATLHATTAHVAVHHRHGAVHPHAVVTHAGRAGHHAVRHGAVPHATHRQATHAPTHAPAHAPAHAAGHAAGHAPAHPHAAPLIAQPAPAAKAVKPAAPAAKPAPVAKAPTAPAPAQKPPAATGPASTSGGLPPADAPAATAASADANGLDAKLLSAAKLAIPADLAAGKAGLVTLTLPSDLYDQMIAATSKAGLTREGQMVDMSAILSGDGYFILPNGNQTARLKPGEAVTFNWQVTPGPDAQGPLKAAVGADLKGGDAPKKVMIGEVVGQPGGASETEAAPATPAAIDARAKTWSILAAFALLVLVILGAVASRISGNRKAAKQQRKQRKATDFGGPEGPAASPADRHVEHV